MSRVRSDERYYTGNDRYKVIFNLNGRTIEEIVMPAHKVDQLIRLQGEEFRRIIMAYGITLLDTTKEPFEHDVRVFSTPVIVKNTTVSLKVTIVRVFV